MNKMKYIFLMITMMFAVSAHAHYFWVNSFESNAHKSHHAMVSLGWGHDLPMSDMLNSVNGRIAVESFELIDPSMKRSQLSKPSPAMVEPSKSTVGTTVYGVDLGVNKIALAKDAPKGVYQVSAVSKPTYYVQYIDKKGNVRLKMKPMDQVKGIAKVLMAIKYQAFAKSYIAKGEWGKPKSLGHGLEIIPRTDLSDVRVGDLIEVDVKFYGKPLSNSPKSREFITAVSNSFGQSDGFTLCSKLKKGKAQFRVQSSGQWIINVMHADKVTEDGDLKDMVGKATQVIHAATLTFNVK